MVDAEQVAVADTPTALNIAGSGARLLLANLDATNPVDLGGSTVASGGGFPLAQETQATVDVKPGSVLYAVAGAGQTVDVAVLRT